MLNPQRTRRAAKASRVERRIRAAAEHARSAGRHGDARFLDRCADARRRAANAGL